MRTPSVVDSGMWKRFSTSDRSSRLPLHTRYGTRAAIGSMRSMNTRQRVMFLKAYARSPAWNTKSTESSTSRFTAWSVTSERRKCTPMSPYVMNVTVSVSGISRPSRLNEKTLLQPSSALPQR